MQHRRCIPLCLWMAVALVVASASAHATGPNIKVTPQYRTVAEAKAAAEKGDALAMLELAWRYEQARDVARNLEEAMKWLRQAADAGDPEAQYFLGRHLALQGDDAGAATWLAQSAAQNHADAAYEYAMALLQGRGVLEDPPRANQFLLMAAEAGHAEAQLQLGLSVLNGRGIQVDEEKALEWMTRSAEQNQPEAQRQLGWMYRLGRGTEVNHRLGLQWILRAAARGHAPAQWDAGVILKDGDGVPANPAQAERWFRRLAEQNHYEAQVELAAIAPLAYQRLTQPLRFRGSQIVSAVNAPTFVAGRVTEQFTEGWDMTTERGQVVEVESRGLSNPRLRPGVFVEVHGIYGENGRVHALLLNLPEPRIAWQHRMELPEVIRASHNQTIRVFGTITNTGVQPIKRAELNIRVWQIASSNDSRRTVVFENLEPGETRAYEQNFSSLAIRDTFQASIPRLDVTGTVVDW